VSVTGVVNVKDMSSVGVMLDGMVLTMTVEEKAAEEIAKVFGVDTAVARMFGT